jgi:hypothetical protein
MVGGETAQYNAVRIARNKITKGVYLNQIQIPAVTGRNL